MMASRLYANIGRSLHRNTAFLNLSSEVAIIYTSSLQINRSDIKAHLMPDGDKFIGRTERAESQIAQRIDLGN